MSASMTEPFKNLLYFARRFKLATALNLLGLIVAFAAFYLIMTQIVYQATYNHDVEDCERLYRLDTDFLKSDLLFSDETYYPFADVLDSMPEVETYSLVPYIDVSSVFASFSELKFQTKDTTMTFTCEDGCNETAVSALTDNVLSGNIIWREDDDPDRRGIIIPRSIAKEYFRKVDVAGDSMMVKVPRGLLRWSIRGVYEDFPENSELLNCIYSNMSKEDKEENKHNLIDTYKCIIKFKQVPDDVDVQEQKIKRAIIDMMEKEGWEKYASASTFTVRGLQKAINNMHIRLTPLKDSYSVTDSISSGSHGFKTMFFVLELACLLLIIIAAIHFLNFMLVESPMRVRGINTRLVLGAPRGSLQRGIIAECVITSVIACIIALILCSMPFIRQIFDEGIRGRYYVLLGVFTLIAAVAVGIIAGYYPAKHITSFAPAMALKGNFGLTPQGHKLRKAIIGIQLFISFLLVIYLGIMIQEVHYIYKSDYGFNKDKVFISTVPLDTSDSTKQVLYNQLRAIPGVENVSFSDGTMGLLDNHGSLPVDVEGQSFSIDPTNVDSAYLHTMGIKVIEGRNFQPADNNVAIINKSASDRINIGSKILLEPEEDSVTIIGVCDHIRYNTTRIASNQPFILVLKPSTRIHLNLSIATSADTKRVQKQANDIIQRELRDVSKLKTQEDKLEKMASKYPTPLVSFNKKLEESYESEFRFFKWIFILSLICTLITLIGVFCLMMFESEYRRKEIGIRKVAGATSGEIVGMLCKQYLPLILISFAAAAPFAALSGHQTLSYFEDHVSMPSIWWVFPLALVIVGGIVMATILLQSWRTARENPVNSIKTE